MWPVRRLQVTPLHWQQSCRPCCHETRRLSGSPVMSALKESSAALSAGMQLPLDLEILVALAVGVLVMVVAAARMVRKRKLAAAMALLWCRLVCAGNGMEGMPNENMVISGAVFT